MTPWPGQRNRDHSTQSDPFHRGRGRIAAGLAALLIAIGPRSVPVPDVAASGDRPELARPHLLTDEIGDVIVRIRGGAVCTGTPITGTRYVVTAAHCVLDHDGHVSGARSVLRDGVVYTAVKLLIDTKYHTTPGRDSTSRCWSWTG